MHATLIFEGRRGVKAVCRLVSLISMLVLLSLAGKDQAHADEAGLFGFFSILSSKPQLNPPRLGELAPWADDMKKARVAYFKGDYEKARTYFEPAAIQGNIVASYYLGFMYQLGRGVPASTLKSLQYYQDVARASSPDEPDPARLGIMIDALVRVADVYREGDSAEDIKPDSNAAFRIYSTAASYGHPSAQYGLGLMSLEGEGVKANTKKALGWLHLAAKNRYAPAEALLGELCWKGDVVKHDRIEALKWYILATQSAQPADHPEIFDRYNSMAGQVGADQLLEAEKRARSWSEKHPLPPPPQGAWPESEGIDN